MPPAGFFTANCIPLGRKPFLLGQPSGYVKTLILSPHISRNSPIVLKTIGDCTLIDIQTVAP